MAARRGTSSPRRRSPAPHSSGTQTSGETGAVALTGGEPSKEGDRTAVGPLVAEPERRTALVGTPAQQAALAHLEHGARIAFLDHYRKCGRIGCSAGAAGVTRGTASRWLEDSVYAQHAAEARLDLADKLACKGLEELRTAFDTPGMVTMHPNLYFHEMNFLEPGRRPNASIQIDARQQTVNVLSPEQAQRVAAALAGLDGEEPVP